jgi:HlyD family secretion protein
MSERIQVLHRALRRQIVAIGVTSVVLVVGLGGWAAKTEISGAVVAPGQLVVNSNVKKVQHPTGGVVGELRVRDGNRVNAGDIVVRLDDTQTRANLSIVTKALDENAARQAREEAERDGADAVAFPQDLIDRMPNLDEWRAQAIRDPPFGARRTALTAPGANRPAQRGDRRLSGADRLQGQSDRLDHQGT